MKRTSARWNSTHKKKMCFWCNTRYINCIRVCVNIRSNETRSPPHPSIRISMHTHTARTCIGLHQIDSVVEWNIIVFFSIIIFSASSANIEEAEKFLALISIDSKRPFTRTKRPLFFFWGRHTGYTLFEFNNHHQSVKSPRIGSSIQHIIITS